MATAVLENVNKFSHLGFKRRPTYDEIINLIDENETITGNLPDRTATFYKASPEGSFFDGTDAMELLKEQQNRIFQRQIQDLLLRQNVRTNGGTFNMERTRQQSSSSSSSSSGGGSSSSTELQPDGDLVSAGIQADLQQRAGRLRSRQQQTGEAHQEEVSRQGRMPMLQGFLSRMSGRQVEQVDSSSSSQEVEEEEESPPKRRSKNRKEKSSSSTARASDALRDIPTITGRFRKS